MPTGTGTSNQFTSQIGNTIVAPDFFTAEDSDGVWILRAPDGQAILWILSRNVDGIDTTAQFGEMFIRDCIPGEPSDYKPSEWRSLSIGEDAAQMQDLIKKADDAASHWRIYALRSGEMYHSIAVNVSSQTRLVNIGFYHNLVLTFRGVRR